MEEKARGGAAQVTPGKITGPGGSGDNSGHLNRYKTNGMTQMAFTEMVWAIKQHGAVASAELSHAGMLAGLTTTSLSRSTSSALRIETHGRAQNKMSIPLLDTLKFLSTSNKGLMAPYKGCHYIRHRQ